MWNMRRCVEPLPLVGRGWGGASLRLKTPAGHPP
ncbi:Hypothetical protein, partial CDS, partial [Neorhizobium galegae bv. officinalis]